MERFLPLVSQDKELLYLQLASDSITYTDMVNFCRLNKTTEKICLTPLFNTLKHDKKEKLLMGLTYLKLKDLCKKYDDVQDICNDQNFWRQKTYRDFDFGIEYRVNRNPTLGSTWKEEYEERFEEVSRKLVRLSHDGDIVDVKELLDFGVDPNTKDFWGWSALIYASKVGHIEIVKMLLEARADPDILDKSGWSSLMWAALKGHSEIVKLLLKYGADPNIQDEKGHTALLFSSMYGRPTIRKLLVNAGAIR